MPIKAIGGYPSLVRKIEKKIPQTSLDSRGFSSSKIADIEKIMEKRRVRIIFLLLDRKQKQISLADIL